MVIEHARPLKVGNLMTLMAVGDTPTPNPMATPKNKAITYGLGTLLVAFVLGAKRPILMAGGVAAATYFLSK